MAKIRLVNPGMEGFSSYMGITKFENGVSVGDVSEREIRLLGALTKIEVIEGDGSTRQGGTNAEMVAHRQTGAPVLGSSEVALEPAPPAIGHAPVEFTAPPAPVDEIAATASALDAALATPATAAAAVEETARIWTEAELARVADKDGIKGLRAIADPMGVKNNSITGLIKEILHVQANPRVAG